MPRFFNTTGPCDPRDHYMLPPERRLPGLLQRVEQKQYFVLHAARQTGKTTAMRAFAARLRSLGYVAICATLEASQGVTETEDAEPIWLAALDRAARYALPEPQRPPSHDHWLGRVPGTRLQDWIAAWANQLGPIPLVLLLDEADTVSGPALVSLLRQLRAGFQDRGPGVFPNAIALIGMRDLRDYLTSAKDGTLLNPGSPFNIKSESITLRGFDEAEVGELYAQHTAETGQIFTPDAISRAFYWCGGQPFLANAFARIAVTQLAPDPATPVTAAIVDQAKEALIRSRTTHLDALGERLKEPRVARIVQQVLLGDTPFGVPYDHDDFQYVVDLGLIRPGSDGAAPANPLYREVLVRQLTLNLSEGLGRPRWRWQTPDGGLDMPALVAAFLGWWRENAAIVEVHAARGYIEAVPHLAFMAFLQRLVNGGGTITREYAAGRGALDLLIEYAGARHVVELKRVPPQHVGPERVRREGEAQLSEYLDTLGLAEGWLLIFDQRPGRSWEDRLWAEDVLVSGKRIHLRGG